MAAKKRAVISVADKRFVTNFARELIKAGYEILSTGGTYRKLKDAGIPAREIGRTLKAPEMLGGRLKTLHSRVMAGILADLEDPKHLKELQLEGLTPISMVVVNFYPFSERVKPGKTTAAEGIELIDIGGPAMVRAAAKNYRHVCVVTDVEQYKEVSRWLREGEGQLTEDQRMQLALAAFRATSEFDNAVARFFEHFAPRASGNSSTEQPAPVSPVVTSTAGMADILPAKVTIQLNRVEHLRYGENPHQPAARYVMNGIPTLPIQLVQGQEPSYNNYLDAAAALAVVSHPHSKPVTACVIKHNNPCGIAIGTDPVKTFVAAREADPKSAFGGIVGINVPVSEKFADELRRTFLEVVVAPDYEQAALAKLADRKNLKLIKASPSDLRQLQQVSPRLVIGPFGGILQGQDTVVERWEDLQVVSSLAPPEELQEDILTGLGYIRFLKSNSIIIVRNGVMIGAGLGQLSRVDATEIAIRAAGKEAKGAVLVSDGFFPFSDSVELAAKAKVACIVAPAGSKRDIEVVEAANQLKVPLVFTPYRHFLH